jgi:hypothetical protein
MVVCASPAKADATETAHVFEFAKMASEVEVTATIPVETERGLVPIQNLEIYMVMLWLGFRINPWPRHGASPKDESQESSWSRSVL